MTIRKALTVFTLSAGAAATSLAMASPASAGGIGDFLSPAFGTNCKNHHGARADGAAAHGTGATNGNLVGLPIGSPFNQCGGADSKPDLPISALLDAALSTDVHMDVDPAATG